MKVSASIVKPENIEVTLTITLTIEQWTKIDEALVRDVRYWPCGKLRDLIHQTISKISAQVHVCETDLT